MDPFLFCEKKWFTPLFCNPKRFCVRGGGVIMRDPHSQITAESTCFPQAGSETFSSDFAGGAVSNHGDALDGCCIQQKWRGGGDARCCSQTLGS